ncbi:PucR family transcriptional regulator [Nocardia mexicana]|uniref:PucR-like helix-turn-helix protein n=1 Tax=Nocardia mexicana TaxID=279262 RepID=A0A370GSF6_9NOCA|nr:helix-turn-helix domain-containing protein [Nocardia mexicana]RDI46441.1 PucR-like helix-turn-helix protein [Nocardia mexicana]
MTSSTLDKSADTVRSANGRDMSAAITRHCLSLAMELLDPDAAPSGSELAAVRSAAALWARQGVPIERIIQTVHEGFRGLPHAVTGGRLLQLLESINTAVASAYLDEQKLAGEHRASAHAVVSALLSGHGVTALTRQPGIRIAESYQVVALRIPSHPEEFGPRAEAQRAERRKLRRVRAALAEAFESPSLALLGAESGTVLIPDDLPDSAGMSDTVLADMNAAAGVDLTATLVASGTDRIPAAAEEAHELLDLVRSIGRPPGLYRLADLAIEYQLTRPSPARDQLTAVIAPLGDFPELLDTLRAYIACGLNRKAAGRRMHVHPNTIDYRLRRIATVTGLDLTTAEGILRARIALLADDLAHARPAA